MMRLGQIMHLYVLKQKIRDADIFHPISQGASFSPNDDFVIRIIWAAGGPGCVTLVTLAALAATGRVGGQNAPQ